MPKNNRMKFEIDEADKIVYLKKGLTITEAKQTLERVERAYPEIAEDESWSLEIETSFADAVKEKARDVFNETKEAVDSVDWKNVTDKVESGFKSLFGKSKLFNDKKEE